MRKGTVTPSTYDVDKGMARLAKPVLGARSIASIRQTDIEKFYLALEKQGAAAGSIERYRKHLCILLLNDQRRPTDKIVQFGAQSSLRSFLSAMRCIPSPRLSWRL